MFSETRKIKICFMLHSAYPLFNPNCKRVFGGAEVNLFYLAKYLSKKGLYDIEFYVGDYGQNDEEHYDGITVKKIKYTNMDKYNTMHYFLSKNLHLFKTLISNKSDVIINSTSGVLIGMIVLCSKFIKRKKVIFRISSDSNIDMKHARAKGLKFYLLYRLGLFNSDVIVSQTEKQKSELKKKLGLDSTIIKNGFFIDNNIDITNKKHILWVSRAVDMKRPELFIRLAEECPEEQFVIIIPGNDPVKDRAREQASKLKNIKLLDYVEFFQIQKYFDEAKLFVNTSEFEGFPNSFIQACLGKTPILSFNVNPDEFLTKNNIGFCCNDDFDLALKFIKDLDSEKIKVYGNNGIKYIQENHDIEKNALKYEEIIKKLLK
ncbi:glycosyltransferase family 4 protein [Pseudobacteroides cellulosolvens]|uniref:Glycosyl transferase group 1 n=1 Tax=Pseudobacteroides cellulosolvens ATCC 35603 = DSM 2933 TaxID=398512 RepID=A0A0L6JL90_9FIRM|nr:glycosyltransferase family 4 protein [Pseudobacteroides cellulosolvens]KNY26596.1 glycosyl transferase group 1 [Pseudobacteroides cellulosolvens ATCC 35603 = DSM 2933]